MTTKTDDSARIAGIRTGIADVSNSDREQRAVQHIAGETPAIPSRFAWLPRVYYNHELHG